MDPMRFLFVYGAGIAWAILLLVAVAIYFVCRGNRYFLPHWWRGWIVFSVAVIVAVPTSTFLLWITPLKAVYPKINQQAPELGFRLLESGGARNLHDYAGKVVLLNVWATYCKPCRDEMPDLDQLQQQYGSRGVVVITLSGEPPANILKFSGLSSMHTVNAYVEGEQKSSSLLACAVGLPAVYIIDSQGMLRETLSGGHDYAFYEQHIRSYLNPVG
jgi:thiol-disulfide isomerase/thioredoxin